MLLKIGCAQKLVCDNGFGSGKTSLIYQFRNILSMNNSWKEPEGFEFLKKAVYLHIDFTSDDGLTIKGLTDAKNSTYDQLLIRKIGRVIEN